MRENHSTYGIVTSEAVFTRQFGRDLYPTIGAALAELWRNGCAASIPPHADWRTQTVTMEIWLDVGTPEGNVLYILDRGEGFTEENLQNFFVMGERTTDQRKNHGASQKRIGKFAAFALIQDEFLNDANTATFRIVSRTAGNGDVFTLECSAAKLRDHQVAKETLPVTTHYMGPFRNVSGSFSLIRIPNCSIASVDEIAEAFKSYLPRRADSQIITKLNGKKLVPPPLPTFIVNGKDGIVAHLELGDNERGVEFVDAETGIVCALGTKLGVNVPYPLNYPRLNGVVFIPGLLQHQNTARDSLNSRWMQSAEWQKIRRILSDCIVKDALKLLGKTDTFGARASSILEDVGAYFAEQYGQAPPGDLVLTDGPACPPTTGPHGGGGGGHGDHDVIRPPKDRTKREPGTEKQRLMTINIAGKTYMVRPIRVGDPARLQGDNLILINTVYIDRVARRLRSPPAVKEHIILLMTMAVFSAREIFSTKALKELVESISNHPRLAG